MLHVVLLRLQVRCHCSCDVYRNKYLGLGTKHSPVSAEASGLAAVTDLVEGGGVRAVLRALPFVGAGKQLRGPTKVAV